MKYIKTKLKNKKGFTLIEIIVVVVILAVLLAVAVPSVLKYLDEANDAKFISANNSLVQTVNAYYAKELIDPENANKSDQKLVTDIHGKLNTNNPEFKELVQGSEVSGYKVANISIYYDGIMNNAGTIDPSRDYHTITKVIVVYHKDGDISKGIVYGSTVINQSTKIAHSIPEMIAWNGTDWQYIDSN